MGRISMPQGKGSQMHNRREYDDESWPEHVDAARTPENVVLVDKDVKAAYQEIFGAALEEYNAKQKRADRKIKDYCAHIERSKNGEKLFYEDVLQWGSKEDFLDPAIRETAKKALMQYVSSFEERNPNLKLIGAYIHMDEASPHLHFDYVPIAHGFVQGLKIRNSLDRAMKEMGFKGNKKDRKNNSTMAWKKRERAYFGDLCRSMGLEVEAEREARGSLSVDEYKTARDKMLGSINQELLEKQKQVKVLDDVAAYIASEASESREAFKAEEHTVPAQKTILGQIKEPERHGVFIEGVTPEQVQALVQRVTAEESIAAMHDRARAQCDTIVAAAQKDAAAIRADATAEKNSIIAEAEAIVREKQSILDAAKAHAEGIINKAKTQAENIISGAKRELGELTEKIKAIKALLGQKSSLESAVADLQAQKADLEPKVEPLSAKVQELTRAEAVLSGKVKDEITKTRFYDADILYADKREAWNKLNNGQLIIISRSGEEHPVKRNYSGGMELPQDFFDDWREGKYRIGWYTNEEKTTVPTRLLKELISARDVQRPISQDLSTMIDQQNTVNQVAANLSQRNRDDYER